MNSTQTIGDRKESVNGEIEQQKLYNLNNGGKIDSKK